MYIADNGNSRIRKVTVSTGIISTIAGTGTATYAGDNGAATAASLNRASGIALDSSGKNKIHHLFIYLFIFVIDSSITTSDNIYVADQSNVRIRKISPYVFRYFYINHYI